MTINAPRRRHFGYGLLGMLITMVCIIILFTIGMTALNQAITGEGSALRGTVRSTQDMVRLSAIYSSMLAHSSDFPQSRHLTPSILDGSGDRTRDTTANLFSAMIALNFARPEDLIAANEFSGYVQPVHNYNYDAYNPQRGSFWDDRFQADLHRVAHVSFAHMPLFGKRFDRGWRATMDSSVVLLGNRGPEDGIDNPSSMTYGRNQQWGGHIVYGDGSIDFVHTFTPPRLVYEYDGQRYPDNIFAMELGPEGDDAILSFTRRMTEQGPELQFD